ncbi:MAG: GTP-binding protein [Clostridia bacterium]|nr:GTP-binding protein [Clostridia bacterium]
MKKEIPVTLLTGYLGAGKTTLLNHVLQNQQGYRVAVIVNDIGEVNIDANYIAKGGVVSEQDNSLMKLSNGCICCTLKEDLMKQMAELCASERFDYILIEASGMSEPAPLIQTIEVLSDATKRYNLPTTVRLDNVVSVVDACRLVDEFGSGKDLVDKSYEEDDVESLIIEQIEFCTKIIINKTDCVSKEQLDEVKAVIKALQPDAEIVEANYGKVELDKILNTKSFEYEKASLSATWIKKLNEQVAEEHDEHEHHHHDEHCHDHDGEHCHCHEHDGHDHDHDESCHCHDHDHDGECHCHEHGEDHDCHCHEHEHHHEHGEGCTCEHCRGTKLNYGIDNFVYTRREPFNKQKFIQFANNNFPKSVIRCKGVIWLSDDEENMHMFEQAGRQKNAFNVGPWVASLPKEQIEQILLENADVKADWRDDIGDRIIKLVFIGKNMQKSEIIKALDECLEK